MGKRPVKLFDTIENIVASRISVESSIISGKNRHDATASHQDSDSLQTLGKYAYFLHKFKPSSKIKTDIIKILLASDHTALRPIEFSSFMWVLSQSHDQKEIIASTNFD